MYAYVLSTFPTMLSCKRTVHLVYTDPDANWESHFFADSTHSDAKTPPANWLYFHIMCTYSQKKTAPSQLLPERKHFSLPSLTSKFKITDELLLTLNGLMLNPATSPFRKNGWFSISRVYFRCIQSDLFIIVACKSKKSN